MGNLQKDKNPKRRRDAIGEQPDLMEEQPPGGCAFLITYGTLKQTGSHSLTQTKSRDGPPDLFLGA